MKFSKCKHCQAENDSDSDSDCVKCFFHPWTVCGHPDCSKLPPIKHEPQRKVAKTVTKKEEDKKEEDGEEDHKTDSSDIIIP
ncbi:hypothetical protein F5B22DRAFT_421754 [Xylaria bambusicola]|uniref:uncharacterized protein n=1 Tax=Xylaria bambusicola TaxID=326684 RepID=UPI002008723D|nr:uncharacterized protein F5B22DRAFT_421754 [Xylaria bambusicola]KAI0523873.1 hypothetical protein F5B22DRAFT_421754 [Xylaria bambusicola]